MSRNCSRCNTYLGASLSCRKCGGSPDPTVYAAPVPPPPQVPGPPAVPVGGSGFSSVRGVVNGGGIAPVA